MIYILWIFLIICFMGIFVALWQFLREQAKEPREKKILVHDEKNISSGEAQFDKKSLMSLTEAISSETKAQTITFLLCTNYKERYKIANVATLLLGSSLIAGLPMLGIESMMSTNTPVPLWLTLTALFFVLLAILFFIHGFNFLQELSRLCDDTQHLGLLISTDGIYISVGTLPGRHLKILVKNKQPGVLLRWPDITSIETKQMTRGGSLLWFIQIMSKNHPEPYSVQLNTLAASQEKITSALHEYISRQTKQ